MRTIDEIQKEIDSLVFEPGDPKRILPAQDQPATRTTHSTAAK